VLAPAIGSFRVVAEVAADDVRAALATLDSPANGRGARRTASTANSH
jgi:hypothetical protein